MMKVTVLYGHPESAESFEDYYAGTHMPIAAKMPGVTRMEATRFVPGPDGAKPPYYRVAELYFDSTAQMQVTLGSPEGQATVGDLPNFATCGVTMLVGAVDD